MLRLAPPGAPGCGTAIYVEVGRYLAGLSIQAMRAQPIYTFFEDDSTLGILPAWPQDYLRWERDKAP